MLVCIESTLSSCLLEAQWLIIRPLGIHRVEGVCRTDDPAAQGNLFPIESIRAFCPIVVFMIVSNHSKRKMAGLGWPNDTLTG